MKLQKAALPIIGTFNSEELASTLKAFSEMDHRRPVLYDEFEKAALPIIGSFNSQELANTANAFAKMDEVAKAAIPIIGTFNAQDVSNTMNAFAKMDHQHPKLFDEVANAAIPIIDTFTKSCKYSECVCQNESSRQSLQSTNASLPISVDFLHYFQGIDVNVLKSFRVMPRQR
eukprot:scaffold22764_cov134-Cylindrotheca_fusiformis.AAC.3